MHDRGGLICVLLCGRVGGITERISTPLIVISRCWGVSGTCITCVDWVELMKRTNCGVTSLETAQGGWSVWDCNLIHLLSYAILRFAYNVNLCVWVIDKYSSNLITCYSISNEVDWRYIMYVTFFHSEGTYLNGMYENKINDPLFLRPTAVIACRNHHRLKVQCPRTRPRSPSW
jgi:hypothetical protein